MNKDTIKIILKGLGVGLLVKTAIIALCYTSSWFLWLTVGMDVLKWGTELAWIWGSIATMMGLCAGFGYVMTKLDL